MKGKGRRRNKQFPCDVYLAEGSDCGSLEKRDKERSSGEVVRWADVLNDLICKQTLALSWTIRHNYQRQVPLLCLEPISQTLTEIVSQQKTGVLS